MHIVIIGNGISGITAARWLRKLSDHCITVISSESEHFYSRTALMYIYMGHMRYVDTKPYEDDFWVNNKIDLRQAHVETIDPNEQSLFLSSGEKISFDRLILALGSKTNMFGWPGQDLKGVSGLYSLQDLATIEMASRELKSAVIVGGGLIGIELAEMLRSRNAKVTMIVREENYWDNVLPKEEAMMINDHIKAHHIDLRLQSNLQEIVSDDDGHARAVIIKETGEEIPCNFVGLTAGVSPNIEVLCSTNIETNKGILVNEYLQTNHPNIYAIGDCVELRQPMTGRRAIEAVWYTGRMMGETVAYTIVGKKVSYNPRLWFNSAKFLDIEYQVYGDVPNKQVAGISHLYWQHVSENKAIRLVYETATEQLLGINVMGVRLRHEVCEKWIQTKATLSAILPVFALAQFDPEFYATHEVELMRLYEQQTGKTLTKKSNNKGFDEVFKFLKRS